MRVSLTRTIYMVTGLLFCTSTLNAELIQNTAPYPTAPTKKGLQVQMLDDAIDLGIHHATFNINLTVLIDPSHAEQSYRWESEGKQYSFTRRTVDWMDQQVKSMNENNVLVSFILLTYHSGTPDQRRIALHPDAVEDKPHAGPIAMFNVVTEEGRDWLRATMEFLAFRYNGLNGHGEVWGYIVGNEVNSHWFWANMGEADAEDVVETYEAAFRLIHSAVRKASLNARLYVSLDHIWHERYELGNERQSIAGRDLLVNFAQQVRKNGDFDWHLAYHPYPEPLTDCRFWNQKVRCPQRNDAHSVSFRNLEVLMDLLSQEEMLWNNAPRRVILSEQGFHCDDKPDAEEAQAAAYALAYIKVDQIDGIDSFILHRHVDHAGEGVLRLGLWTNVPGSVSTPDRKRLMHRVFHAAGTPEQDQVFEFALPVIGVSSWEEALDMMRRD